MPTQEDRVLARIRQTTAYIRDNPKGIGYDAVESWAYATLGVRPRTTAMYISSLIQIGTLKYEKKEKLIFYMGGDKPDGSG